MSKRKGAGAPPGNKNALKHGHNTDLGRAATVAARAMEGLVTIASRIDAINEHIEDVAAVNPLIAKIISRSPRKRAVSKKKKQSR